MTQQPPGPPPWPPPAWPPVMMATPVGPPPYRPPGGRPGWVTALGVLCIIFGSLGIMGAGYAAIQVPMMRMQRQMMSTFETLTTQAATQPANRPPPEFLGIWKRMFYLPPWVEVFVYVSSGLGLVLNTLCLVAGIGMFGLRPWSRRLALAYAIGAMACSAMEIAVGIASGAVMLMWGWMCGGLIGMAYPIVLLCFLVPRGRAAVFQPAQ